MRSFIKIKKDAATATFINPEKVNEFPEEKEDFIIWTLSSLFLFILPINSFSVEKLRLFYFNILLFIKKEPVP